MTSPVPKNLCHRGRPHLSEQESMFQRMTLPGVLVFHRVTSPVTRKLYLKDSLNWDHEPQDFPEDGHNPNCMGWDQSWPRQLRCQIPGTIVMYQIEKISISAKRSLIFFNFGHDIQKKCFDIHFDVFLSEVRPWPPCRPPSTLFYCYYRPSEGERSPARLWSAVWRSTSQDSNRFWSLTTHSGEGWRFSVWPALSLFLGEQLAMCRVLGKFLKL